MNSAARIEDIQKRLFSKLSRVAHEHHYDLDECLIRVNAITGGMGVPLIRDMFNNLLKEHHYDLVGILAEFMVNDGRVSYQKTGKTYQRMVSKAPKESPELLRMLDRVAAGLLCFRAKVVINNPWTGADETRVLKVYAKNEAEATEIAKCKGQFVIPGASVIQFDVRSISDDSDVDKADVVNISLIRDVGHPAHAEVNTFAAANDVLMKWMEQLTPADRPVTVRITAEWESGGKFSFITAISCKKKTAGMDVAGQIKEFIALVLDDAPLPNFSPAESESKRAELRKDGAIEHCSYIRATCLLGDRN